MPQRVQFSFAFSPNFWKHSLPLWVPDMHQDRFCNICSFLKLLHGHLIVLAFLKHRFLWNSFFQKEIHISSFANSSSSSENSLHYRYTFAPKSKPFSFSFNDQFDAYPAAQKEQKTSNFISQFSLLKLKKSAIIFDKGLEIASNFSPKVFQALLCKSMQFREGRGSLSIVVNHWLQQPTKSIKNSF